MIRLLPILFLYLLFPFLVYGNNTDSAEKLAFKQLRTPSFLPTNEVRNLYQDSEGYIWISTYNGLLRYDGYSTIAYQAGADGKGYAVDGFINVVSEDLDHNLWIGTHNGLFCLNKHTGLIKKVVSAGLHISFVEVIKCTSNGDIWVGATQGLYCRKKGSEEFVRLFPSRSLDVKTILEDHHGYIWFGTWKQGLFRYDPVEGQLYEYEDINEQKSAHILFQSKDHSIWIGTWRYGLMRIENPYDMENYSFVRYRRDPSDSSTLLDDIVYSIAQDKNTGNLWIGTRRGLSIFIPEENRFVNYLPEVEKGGLPFGEVDALLCSRDGLMWVGMLGGGVCTVNTHQKQFGHDSLDAIRQYSLSSSVRSIYQDDDDSLWLGIMGFGFVKYYWSTKQLVPYQKLAPFSSLPYVSVVNEFVRRRTTKELCVATWDDGLWLYDGKRVRVINSQNYPQLPDVCIYSVLEDRKGNLWLGTRSGIAVLTPDEKLLLLSELVDNMEDKMLDVSVFKLCEDGKGNIWGATPTSGVWKISESQGHYQLKRYAANYNNAEMVGAMSLAVDSYDRVWAGTNGSGICIYQENQDCFKACLNEHFGNEVIYCMLEDDSKGMWVTSNSEMYHIVYPPSGQGLEVRVYTIEDGLQDYIFNRNACFKGNNGLLFFGGVRGFNAFDPKVISYDSQSYPVVITDLKINNTSIREIPYRVSGLIMSESLDYAKEVTLDHTQNNFSIDFSVLNFINPELNKYEYQLEGYDTRWISVGSERHFAYYSNLPSGKYIFKVKGANANGIWSKNMRTLTIHILPPPWLSWWAYCLYTLLVFLCFYIAYRVVQKRIHLKHVIELGNVERQKLEELSHSKLQFFTNITHELLTPLSIMSALLDELRIQHPELKSVLADFSVNMTRLTRLIQQILEFRKIENNRQKLRVSEGNITKFLRQSVLAFTPLVRKKHLQVVFVDGNMEFEGYFDIDKLDKIAYNLLSNAAKYTPEGKVITVKQFYDAESRQWGFSVNNPGDVIPEERMSHLFERFYEGEYRRFHTNGTGIGLSLTKDLVTLHHGKIDVTSTVDDGNTFTIVIPVNKEAFAADEIDDTISLEDIQESEFAEEDNKTVVPVVAPRSFGEENKNKSVVLLVEDNEELCRIVARRLSDYFEVMGATSAELALDELNHHKVDIVITDVMMKGMDGFDLCRKIKNTFETSHIPVIILTACTADVNRVKGYEVGADGYLCKPFNMNVLLAKIDNLLKRRDTPVNDSRKKLIFEAKEVSYTSQDEIFLRKAVECVNNHLGDLGFGTAQFTVEMGMSRSACNDKLKELTGMTPLAFISSIRLQAAFRMMQENKKIRISDLAYAVGFNDPKYFSQCFKKKFGFLPKEYMTKTE